MNRLPMHDALKPLAWLEGTWITRSPGQGTFPTIKPFNFHEKITFESIGQPMFNYVAQSWHPEKGSPMHREVGYLKVIPGTNKVLLLLAHNFGLTTIEEGSATDKKIQLKTVSITRQPIGCKDPAVCKIEREFEGDGKTLLQIVRMATTTTSESTEHLRTTYVKLNADDTQNE